MTKYRELLGSDIIGACEDLGSGIVHVEEITRLQSRSDNRACFKLTLRDGREIKARRFPDSEQRRYVSRLSPFLDGLPFSRIISTHGSATIEEWIDGTSVKSAELTIDQTRMLAAVLARVHTTENLPEDMKITVPPSSWYLERLKFHLTTIVNSGALVPDQAQKLLSLAEANRPEMHVGTLIHTDFHPGNMVIDSNGNLTIIDNEHLSLGSPNFDVARCWVQWPMSEAQRSAFCTTYSGYRDLEPFLAHQVFWALRTTALSANFHIANGGSAGHYVETLSHIAQGDTDRLWPQFSRT